MFFLGNIPASSTVYLPFDTYDSNGASVTITGLAVTDIEIYKNGSVTQRSSDNGYALLDTDGIDFDATTGLHGFSIDLADNSDAGFYAAGAQYWVNVNAITVDAQTVRFTYYFRLVAAESIVGTPKVDVTHLLGTAWLTPAVAGTPDVNVKQLSGDATAADNAEAFFDGTGYAGTNNVIPTVTTLTNLPAIPAGWLTAAGIAAGALNGKGDWNIGKTGYALSGAGVQAIWDALTSALTTVGSIGKLLVDNINATISSRSSHSAADVWAAGTRTLTAATNITSTGGTTVPQTGDSFARIGAAGAGLTDLGGMSTTMKAQVNAEADTALSDAGVTSARQAKLDEVTAARMAELDAANLPADIDQLKADNPNRPTRGVALADLMFMMVDATDLNTPETGVTVTATISKDGAAFAACANAVSEVSGGWYKITLTATELTADSIALKMTGTGCAQRNIAFRTQPT